MHTMARDVGNYVCMYLFSSHFWTAIIAGYLYAEYGGSSWNAVKVTCYVR